MTLLHAELRKLLTLPSIRLTAVLTLACTALLASLDAPSLLRYVQAGFLILGVYAAASEYQAGAQIRITLLAMPRRLLLYAAKLAALIAVTAPVAALVGRSVPATVYLTLTAVLAAAVGTVVRRAEPAAVLLLTVYYVVCPLLRARFPAAACCLPDTLSATAAWACGAAAAAVLVLHRRDA